MEIENACATLLFLIDLAWTHFAIMNDSGSGSGTITFPRKEKAAGAMDSANGITL